jgi:PAS domain S-box-containing protein
MTGGDGGTITDDAAAARFTVLLVGDDDLAASLQTHLQADGSGSVRTSNDRTGALESLADVDCVVSTIPVADPESAEFLEAVLARDETLPFIAFSGIADADELLNALTTGYTDVVPRDGESAVVVLAERVHEAVRAARARERATERAAALRAERDRFAALFENIPEPTVFYELDDGDDPVVLDVNPAFESVFGYDAETVRGDLVDDYIVPSGKKAEAAALNDRIADGEHLDTEVTRLTATGEREFLLRDVPLAEADRMRGYAIYTDITPQREREERLREATTRLEAQNDRLEAFTGVVSHDLRHPLSVAMTYTELLQERYDDDDLDAVENALDRMDDLIQDLLALAQQGTQAQDRRLLDLEPVVRDAWNAVDTGGATLSIAFEGVALRADEGRISQLFENLFANSVTHATSDETTPDGVGDALTVTVGLLGDGDSGRGFYVADDGVGIPETERDRVFEQGYTGADGTGFGLAIVEAVVDAHDWTVTLAESEAGGARFEFTDVDVIA